MSLLAQMNQPNGNLSASGAPQYYFALDSTPVDPTVTAPAFTATGAGPTPVGTFTARGNGVPGGFGMFNMAQSAGTQQWGIGMKNTPAGANSGNDLAIYSYDDNGAFLGEPLAIDRSTGGVTVSERLVVGENLEVDGSAVVGTAATVGGGDIQVNGTLGVAQVYDNIYNRPNPGTEVLISTYGPTGVAGPLVQYVAPKTGLYTLTMEVKADANGGFAWTNGTSCILGYLQNPFPPFDLLSDAFLSCDSMANPTGMVLPTAGGAVQNDAYVKDSVAIVNLVGGTTYAAQININPAGFNLGTTGGIRFFIQPVVA